MSTAIAGQAIIDLLLRDKQFKSQWSAFTNSFTSSMRRVAEVAVGTTMARSVTSIGDALSGWVRQGIEFNAAMEQAQEGMTVMLGSANLARTLLGKIRTFANETPLEFPELQQAAVMLLATKKVGEGQVMPMLKKLGDAAAGSAKGFKELPHLILAISQMLGKGKIKAEEMNQITQAGISPWLALSKAMGVSEAKLRDMAKKGELGMDAIHKLIDGLGQQFEGMTEKQSKTFNGLMSTIRNGIGMALGKVTMPLFDEMKKGAQQLVAFLNSKDFAAWTQKIAQGVSTVISYIKSGLQNPIVQTIVKFAAIAATVGTVSAAIAGLATFFGPVIVVAAKIAAIVTAITAGLQLLSVMVQRAFASPAGEKMRTDLAEIWRLVQEIWRNVKEGLTPAFQAAGEWIGKAFGAAGPVQAGFTSFLASAISGLRQMAEVASLFTTNWSLAWQGMKQGAALAASYLWDSFKYFLNEQLPFGIAAAIDGFIAGATELGKHWKTVFKAVGNFIADVFDALFKAWEIRILGLSNAVQQIAKGRPGDALETALIAENDAKNAQYVGMFNAGKKFANSMSPVVASVSKAVNDAVGKTMRAMPAFKQSDRTTRFENDFKATLARMFVAREKVRQDRKVADMIDMISSGIKAAIGGVKRLGLPTSFEGAGKGLAGLGIGAASKVSDLLGMFKRTETKEEEKEKRKAKFESVGFADLNKKIQDRLSPEGKDKREALKAAKDGVAEAKKGNKFAEAIGKGIRELTGTVRGLNLGFTD